MKSALNRHRWLTLFTTTLLLGCGAADRQTGEALVYWSANNPYEQEVARAVVAEWNTRYPDRPVVHQPVPEGQSSEEVILAAIVGKTTPDVYSNVWPGDVEFYVRARALVRIDQFDDAAAYLSERLGREALDSFRARDGGLYQVPWKTNPIMMLYNVRMLRDIGYDQPPRTYSEYLDAAEKLKRRSLANGQLCWIGIRDVRLDWYQRFFDFYTLYLAASGGRMLLTDGRADFDNSAAVGVFQFLRALYANDYFPMQRSNLAGDLFLLGRVATRFTGPWEIAHLEKFKTSDFEYDLVPVPVPDTLRGPVYTYGDIKSIVIFSTCRRPQHAWEFVKFLVSRQSDYRLLTMATQLPLRQNLLADSLFAAYFKQQPKLLPFARQSAFVRGVDQAPVMKEIFDIISQEYEAAVLYAVKTPEQAIHDAAARVNIILE